MKGNCVRVDDNLVTEPTNKSDADAVMDGAKTLLEVVVVVVGNVVVVVAVMLVW